MLHFVTSKNNENQLLPRSQVIYMKEQPNFLKADTKKLDKFNDNNIQGLFNSITRHSEENQFWKRDERVYVCIITRRGILDLDYVILPF